MSIVYLYRRYLSKTFFNQTLQSGNLQEGVGGKFSLLLSEKVESLSFTFALLLFFYGFSPCPSVQKDCVAIIIRRGNWGDVFA